MIIYTQVQYDKTTGNVMSVTTQSSEITIIASEALDEDSNALPVFDSVTGLSLTPPPVVPVVRNYVLDVQEGMGGDEVADLIHSKRVLAEDGSLTLNIPGIAVQSDFLITEQRVADIRRGLL